MLPRKLSSALILLCVLGVSGIEPTQNPQPVPAPFPGKNPTIDQAGRVQDHLASVNRQLDGEIKDLVLLYKHLHANPELSLMEMKTAARLAVEARKLGYQVTEKVGGNGVVAVLKNGTGPVVLIRTDMAALPVVEQTGLPDASKVKVKDLAGPARGRSHCWGSHDA